MSTLHQSTFGYLDPTVEQKQTMATLREAAKNYADTLEAHVPPGADKTYLLRKLREVAMWVNVAVTRNQDGIPRGPSHPMAEGAKTSDAARCLLTS